MAALRVAECAVLMAATSPTAPTSQRLIRASAALARRWLGVRQLNHLVRFAPVLELVTASGAPNAHVLDVGSGSQGISTLLPQGWRATAVDANFDDYAPEAAPRRLAAYQQLGDVRDLPFEDASFDLAVAVDLLEHVPPADRATAVSEICRVSRRRAVIACPAGAEALAADARLADRFRAAGRTIPPWLEEHIEHGFPEVAELVAAAQSFGMVSVIGNESIRAHERLVWAENQIVPAVATRLACRPLEAMLTSSSERLRAGATQALRTVRGGDQPPTYRAIVVVSREVAG
jgi:methyltransferase family protein